MNNEQTIPLEEDITTYLQMLSYEAEGYRVLCVHAAECGLPSETRTDIMQKYGESFAAYRMALDEIVRGVVPEEERAGLSYSVDFLRSLLVLRRQK